METIYEHPILTTWFICLIFFCIASVVEAAKKNKNIKGDVEK